MLRKFRLAQFKLERYALTPNKWGSGENVPQLENSTPPRVHFAHAIFSRVWLKIESQTQCEANRVRLKDLFVILAHHVSFALVMV